MSPEDFYDNHYARRVTGTTIVAVVTTKVSDTANRVLRIDETWQELTDDNCWVPCSEETKQAAQLVILRDLGVWLE